ncbi:MAG TPA: group II intron maturase-specific domain-containing protein [Salinivirga sp.]|uniref:group II intron maturase-specific domain-containing protein n=1 Tax=Salinivirga sp. TaxID=1970192 RepID=UPI002B48193B|nr:group II intron maturase-specific domain-containing protein [Salinivirga sp.]HKK58321.1 group II intron maturase-specific domain-containing protein [Salinivirga sp.]
MIWLIAIVLNDSKNLHHSAAGKKNSKTCNSIVGVAQKMNPSIRGWVNYYRHFNIWKLHKVFRLLHKRLVRWARRKYKRYKNSLRKAYKWLKTVRKQIPYLFYHWELGFSI